MESGNSRNCVRSNAIEEMLRFLAKREIPFEQFRVPHIPASTPINKATVCSQHRSAALKIDYQRMHSNHTREDNYE